MTKSILLQRLNHSSLSHTTTGLARRALLLVSFLLLGLGSAWGGQVPLFEGSQTTVTISSDEIPDIFNTTDGIILRVFGSDLSQSQLIITTTNDQPFLNAGQYFHFNFNQKYYDSSENCWKFELNIEETKRIKSDGLKVVAEWNGTTVTKITYEIPATDDFNGTYLGSEPTPIPYVIDNVEESSIPITFTPTISNAKYARFVLVKDGKEQEISSSALTLGSGEGQTSDEWLKRGVYFYRESGLTDEDLTVTVSLEAGTFPEYQLVAYFSDEAPTLEGTTITKEPENLKEKQIYSFSYPVKTVDVYFEWDKTSQEIDLRSYLQNDLPVLLESNLEKGYIAWSIYDGPYGVGSPIDVHNNQNEWPHTYWAIILPNGFEIDNPKDYRWSDYLKTTVFTPEPQKFSDYPDYVVVCEVSDESKNNIKVRYIFHFNEDGKVPFPGKLVGEKDGKTQLVSRSNENVPIELSDALNHEKLTDGVKYARFYLTDYKGNLVDPTDKLTVSGGNVSTCTETEFGGFYIYYGSPLNLSDVSVTLNTPKEYKLYKVVGVFATNMETAIFENDEMLREPDWDLQYTYSFTYPTLDEIKYTETKSVEWTRKGMKPEVSIDNPDTDWNISWEELAVEQYVKWYVVDNAGNVQPLVRGRNAKEGAWTIAPSDYTVTDDVAVLTGKNTFTSALWNTWGSPKIYAPADKDYETVKDYKIICEVYSNKTGEAVPNAKYTFTFNKKYPGELKVDDGSRQGGETMELALEADELVLPLGNAQKAYNGLGLSGTLKYVRIWLTTLSGTLIDPNNKLTTTSGTVSHPNGTTYGYYLTSGFNLTDETLKLDAGTYNQYQVHVAFSTDALTSTYEPDYDYVYTFSFNYAMKIVHKSLICEIKKDDNSNNNSIICTPNLLENSIELSIDCGVDKQTLQDKLYVRWYLTNKMGNVISEGFNFDCGGYTNVGTGNGYCRKGGFTFYDYGNNQGNNPRISLSGNYDYKDVHIVCVATVKTDNYEVDESWIADPAKIQVKYIYTLYTETDVKNQPFVHYQGEAYRYLIEEMGDATEAKKRDYAIVDGNAPANNYTWNIFTNSKELTTENIRQSVHTWEYNIYVKPGETYPLILPFQYFKDSSQKGQANEPQAYIRWYDWNTDKKVVSDDGTFEFNKFGTFLTEKDRGLFYIWKENTNLCHDNVGVTFTPSTDFSRTIDIACDVSKYSDGMVEIDNTYYLLREPTLSNRYIFHIHPANEIAERLAQAKQNMDQAAGNADALYEAMSNLEEDKGKVVVSVKNDKTRFSLRLDLQDLSDYIINKTSLKRAGKLVWYAYYETNNGIQRSPSPLKEADRIRSGGLSNRISDFEYSTFRNLYDGDNFHVVGFVKEDDNSTDEYPVAHYELRFIDAPAIPLDNIIAGDVEDKYINRTEPYMQANKYTKAAILDFDGNPKTNPNVIGKEAQYYSTQNWYDEPTSPADNLTYVPFSWEDIQYGFCYPKLTPTIKDGHSVGVAPDHGDYIVLKSMYYGDVSPDDPKKLPFGYGWWDNSAKEEIHDYTFYATNRAQHGSFLYTDASDESRSIATIPFTAADLCGGSSFYFTAIVANKTYAGESSHTPPQLLIRIVGIKDDGTRERIVAFHSSELSTGNGVNMGKWYQIYGTSTLPRDFDSSITEFEAEVINYANGTLGADFAFDQFVIYTTTAKVLLTQTPSSSCGPESIAENEIQIYMEAEGLQNAFGDTKELQPIYWRIYEEGEQGSADKLITGTEMYPWYDKNGKFDETVDDAIDAEGKHTYGITWVKPNFTSADLGQITKDHPFGWYQDPETGKYFFQIANKSFSALERGKNYYVSVYQPCTKEEFEDEEYYDESLWGSEKVKCSIFSEFFIPRRQYVTYIVDPETGKEGGELTMECGSDEVEVEGIQMVLKVPDPNDKITGFKTYPMNFDYAFCSMEDWDKSDVYLEGTTDYTYNDLAQAWRDYRDQWLKDNNLTPENYSNSEHKQYSGALNYAINHNILILDNEPTFTHRFTKNETNRYHVICLPITTIIDGAVVCDAFEVIFNIKTSGGPLLTLGFDDVDYSKVDGYRVVRVGLEQIKNMQSNGYLLHIPVNMFKGDVNGEKNEGALEIDGDYLELLPNTSPNLTTDLNVTSVKKVAKFIGDNNDKLIIDRNRMYISLNFHGDDISPQTFYEGFTYHMFFQVKKAGEEEGACEAPVNFLLKVVPEFVTWKGGNNQWNSDGNWSRSTRVELYKGEAGEEVETTDNHGTPAHPNGYKDNDDLKKKDENLKISDNPAFVPMKFTYVTVPSVSNAPNLNKLEINDTEGIYTQSTLNDDIRYDLMVRYTEKTCIDHGIIDIPVYDCEKFYGNWAKEIYFKPGAELVNQHYLTYEKVWVEKLLTANTWTLMSTPLQNTYAGDMYVPAVAIPDYSKDDGATVIGQQVTEAFQPITFADEDKNGKKIYSRTKYPIYQRSWAQAGSTVYTKTNDVRANSYSANIVTSTVGEKLTQWSHTYNDVQVPYSTWTGFAIRAHKKGNVPNALLRLPKEDDNYDYYQWDGTSQNPAADGVKTVSKTTTGKLFTDNTLNINGLTYGVVYGGTTPSTVRTAGNGEVNVDIDDVQKANGYLLVGNPYLCSIDMAQFLSENSRILDGSGYWTYEDNKVSPVTSADYIKPLQSFFVKLNSDASVDKIVFNESMMVGNNGTNGAMPTPALTLTASNGRGQSSATLSVGEEARSVETLFDSNLEDVPMVYTVADGQAVSIHQLTELDRPIAFGVTCAASDETVEVTFTDVAQLTTGDVFVVDAVTGSQTAVGEGSVLGIQPNDYGRYFLLAGTTTIGSDRVDVQKGIVVSVRGKEVTVTSGEELTQVRALSLSGASVYQDAVHGLTTSFTLSSGVYIIQAENVAGEQQTVKVVVK